MENTARAILRYAHVSPLKARQVINLIRGKDVATALAILQQIPKRSARIVEKLLKSAIANAEFKGMDVDNLYITKIHAEQGPMLKRYTPKAHGRATMIRRRFSHIYIYLAERNQEE
ncbi:MAG: 50S ribosomal protein L22 [Hydrogenothermaceae bacterium]|nr:50S ribosomal protein L22 [Hydrogenothermaceae bacterium]